MRNCQITLTIIKYRIWTFTHIYGNKLTQNSNLENMHSSGCIGNIEGFSQVLQSARCACAASRINKMLLDC